MKAVKKKVFKLKNFVLIAVFFHCSIKEILHRSHLWEIGLGVDDVAPVFSIQTMGKFILPHEGPVFRAGTAIHPAGPLRDDAPYSFGDS